MVLQFWGLPEHAADYYSRFGNGYETTDWNNIPVYKWRKINKGWSLIRTEGAYREYISRDDYSYKWSARDKMCVFTERDPEPEICVFMSPGMEDAVNEILSTTPEEALN